jgi:hypothetical protein
MLWTTPFLSGQPLIETNLTHFGFVLAKSNLWLHFHSLPAKKKSETIIPGGKFKRSNLAVICTFYFLCFFTYSEQERMVLEQQLNSYSKSDARM